MWPYDNWPDLLFSAGAALVVTVIYSAIKSFSWTEKIFSYSIAVLVMGIVLSVFMNGFYEVVGLLIGSIPMIVTFFRKRHSKTKSEKAEQPNLPTSSVDPRNDDS